MSTPQRLYLMQVASLPPTNIPVPTYLIQTDDDKNILIDSGLPDKSQMPPELAHVEMGENVLEQLARLGLEPGDIDLLICTHFDLDHGGSLGAFINAERVVQRSHFEHAQNVGRFANTRSQWDQSAARYRFVDGDTELLTGLTLIETSGHTRGHQSVLVHLPETGPVLLTIDAVPLKSSFVPDREAGQMDEDLDALRASTRKLLELVEREQVSLVIFGHDAEQWQTLKKAPEYYS